MTLQVDVLQTAEGGPTELTKQRAAKVWSNLNGTGTIAIRDSFNIASVIDNGTGDYTETFTNSFSSADYCPLLSGSGASGVSTAGNSWFSLVKTSTAGGAATSKTVSELNITSVAGSTAIVDAPDLYLTIQGDLA